MRPDPTLGPSDPRTLGPSDPRTLGPSDPRTLGPSDPRTLGPSDPRTLPTPWHSCRNIWGSRLCRPRSSGRCPWGPRRRRGAARRSSHKSGCPESTYMQVERNKQTQQVQRANANGSARQSTGLPCPLFSKTCGSGPRGLPLSLSLCSRYAPGFPSFVLRSLTHCLRPLALCTRGCRTKCKSEFLQRGKRQTQGQRKS